MNLQTQTEKLPIADEHIEQVLELAERLRAVNGGELDDNAILAVAEATGAPVDYVRLAVRLRGERQRQTLAQRVRTEILQLEPAVRMPVLAAAGGTLASFLFVVEAFAKRGGAGSLGTVVGVFGWLSILATAYVMTTVRTTRIAAISGAVFGALFFTAGLLGDAIFGMGGGRESSMIMLYGFLGLVAFVGLQRSGDRIRERLGVKDASQERQELLRELVSLQDKLRSNEQGMTFLSLDIVGSTRMKAMADPLSVEFTFNEYHQFVEMIARKHGGRVHSTAGDGVTCAFENPIAAMACAKNIQTGLIELNTFRNKIGHPIVLRAGIHSGSVVLPDASDVQSVNFAHVIDVASHIQKVCPPGGIAVTEAAAMMLPGGPNAVGSQWVETQESKGVVWLPRLQAALPG